MAGAGYKLFVSGDVLTAAQVNTYLNEQTVMVFATSAARTSALSAVLAEGMMSYLQDSNTVFYYDGAAWNALASGDITAITAGNGISVTSGTGPVPTVAIDTAVTADLTTAQTLTNKTLTSPALTTPTISTLTTNGDVLYGTGSGALARLGIGSTGNVLTVASGIPSWSAPAGGGGLTLLSTTNFTTMPTTVSSISGSYKHLQIILRNIDFNVDSIYIRFNGDSGNNYNYGGFLRYSSATSNYNAVAANLGGVVFYEPGNAAGGARGLGQSVINVYNYTSTDVVYYEMRGTASDTGYPAQTTFFNGVYDCSAAITSVTFFSNSGGTPAGTILIYGVS